MPESHSSLELFIINMMAANGFFSQLHCSAYVSQCVLP